MAVPVGALLARLFNEVPYREVPVALSRNTERRIRRFIDDANEAFSRMEPAEDLIDDNDAGIALGLGVVVARGLEAIDAERRSTRSGKETILVGRRGRMSTQEIADAALVIELDPENGAGRVLKVREYPEDHYIVDVVL